MDKHEAILELNSSVVSIKGDTAYDVNGNEVSYDADAVQTLVDSKAYQDNRRSEYPDIGDQLDDLFKAGAFSTEMTATIQAVKDKYPKE
jgi:hypothetical protein